MDTFQLRATLNKISETIPANYWAMRILEQLNYLLELSESRGRALDEAIRPGVVLLKQRVDADQAITPATVKEVEQLLADLSAEAKSLKLMCVANAHIDMNWMWGYQETVALTVDTVRTVLTLMDEYPDFIYTQPQASVYAIIEEYAPELLDIIRKRVKEGRWEACVSGWVEQDKNMSSTESMARHLLYARRYISNLLDIDPEQLDLDFAPDTFGHGRYIPELLNKGGIRYYYHCRGHEGPNLFRWQAASGAEVIAYREPVWYNVTADYNMARYVPRFCKENNVDATLLVYGVGDHGGGPTRRDLERLQDMQTWPLFPTLVHSSLRQFYQHIETFREHFPVVRGELNFVFTGCYTTQSRIKRANRYGETKLYEAETLEAMANAWDPEYRVASGEKSWRKVLFNQFHDILPGSGTVETREYAMGEFQNALAWTETTARRAMQRIAAKVAGKNALPEVGVGIFTDDCNGYGVSSTGVVADQRYYILFNTTARERQEMTELMLWDWQHTVEHIQITDENGEVIPHQVIGTGKVFWGHDFVRIILPAKVPSMGYSVCCVRCAQPDNIAVPVNREPRQDRFSDHHLVLENEHLKAVFRQETMQCIQLLDKKTGKQLIDSARPSCGFELVTETAYYGMSAWRVGPAIKTVCLNETQPVYVIEQCYGPLRQRISYYMCFEGSRLDVSVTLDAGSDRLDISVKADWHELGGYPKGVPLLRMPVSIGYAHDTYRYLTAGGYVDRPAIAYDVPSLGLGCAVAHEGVSLAVLSDCKYGFRGCEDTMRVSLLRSAYEPDPCPDQGIHYINIALQPVSADGAELEYAAARQMHPVLSCVLPVEEGSDVNMTSSLLSVSGGNLVAVKKSEDGKALILRLTNPSEQENVVQISLGKRVLRAYTTDLHENYCGDLACADNMVAANLAANSVCSVAIELE